MNCIRTIVRYVIYEPPYNFYQTVDSSSKSSNASDIEPDPEFDESGLTTP